YVHVQVADVDGAKKVCQRRAALHLPPAESVDLRTHALHRNCFKASSIRPKVETGATLHLKHPRKSPPPTVASYPPRESSPGSVCITESDTPTLQSSSGQTALPLLSRSAY